MPRSTRYIYLLFALLLSSITHQAYAACPDSTQFDEQLGFCASDRYVFGHFTQAMTQLCEKWGGGSACTATRTLQVGSKKMEFVRWGKSFASKLRGNDDCPLGSVRSPTYGSHCFEFLENATNNVYGNFSDEEIAKCEYLQGGQACYSNRWSSRFYASVSKLILADDATPPEPTPEPLVNKLGAWLWYIDESGLNKTHAQLADELASMGVKRIYIKIADDSFACSLFSDVCSTTTSNTYKSRGIEPWVWSYNYPGNSAAQADALYQAAKYGYVGYIADVEVEFNYETTSLHNLFGAFIDARQRAIADGYAAADFPLGATTWSNPKDQGMRVDIIDQYVDFHMPQTYLEVWGSSYMANPKRWIEEGNCEYRALGANKPIWHIVSTEYDEITVSELDAFIQAAGPNASIWRIPGGAVPQAVWNDWSTVNWARENYDEDVACATGNNTLKNYLTDSGQAPEPQDPQTPQPQEPEISSVPHWNQNYNARNPSGTCSITSLAMVTDFFGLTDPEVLGQRTPDYLNDRFGVLQTVPDLAWGFNVIAQEQGSSLRDYGTTRGTIAELRSLASQGRPIIVHGWFTNPGHIMVVTGFDGEYYTVNDPYGIWNNQKWGSYDSYSSGKNVKYHKDAFEYAINDNGNGDDLWMHIFE